MGTGLLFHKSFKSLKILKITKSLWISVWKQTKKIIQSIFKIKIPSIPGIAKAGFYQDISTKLFWMKILNLTANIFISIKHLEIKFYWNGFLKKIWKIMSEWLHEESQSIYITDTLSWGSIYRTQEVRFVKLKHAHDMFFLCRIVSRPVNGLHFHPYIGRGANSWSLAQILNCSYIGNTAAITVSHNSICWISISFKMQSPCSHRAWRLFYPSNNLRAYECVLPVRN